MGKRNTDVQYTGPYDWIAEDSPPSLYIYQQQMPIVVQIAKLRYQGKYLNRHEYLVASGCHDDNRKLVQRLLKLPPYSEPVSQRKLGQNERIENQYDEVLYRKENQQPYTREDLLVINHKSESLGVATLLSESFREETSFQARFEQLKKAQRCLEESDTALG